MIKIHFCDSCIVMKSDHVRRIIIFGTKLTIDFFSGQFVTQYSQPTLQSQSTAPAQTPPPDVNGEQIVLFQPSVASTPVRTNQNDHVNRAIPSEPPIRTMHFPPSRQGPVTSNCNPGNPNGSQSVLSSTHAKFSARC